MRAYRHRRAYQRKLYRDMTHELDALREYQQLKSAWLDGEAAIRLNKLQMQEDEARAWDDDVSERVRQSRAEAAAAKLCQFGGDSDAVPWADHETRWAAFEASDASIASDADVPWPPAESGVLSAMATLELEGAPSPLSAYAAHKRAFRKASMRWHPDKFIHRFGRRIPDAAVRDAVTSRVQQIAQGVNTAWEEIVAAGGT